MTRDPRSAFFVENFGYVTGGVLEVIVHPGVKVWVERGSPVEATHRMGFLIRKTRSDSAEYVDEYQTSCLLDAFGLGPGEKTEEGDAPAVSDTPMDYISLSNLSTWETGVHFRRVIGPGEEGLYNLFWYNCMHSTQVSLKVDVVMYNPGPDYLSEGKSPLPTLYFTFTLLHAVLAVTLVVFMRKPSAVVYKVHYLALAVAILRTLTLFVMSLRFHYMKSTGHGTGWNVVFYILKGLTGLFLFTLIALVGTGFSFVKAYLTDRDKKVFLVVIPLQLISNIALIMVDEMQPGSRAYMTWYDILRIADIVCCGVILLPIVWSIKHLQDASSTDGKGVVAAAKLKIFRQFYMLVIAWLYFTRIIVYMLEATVPYQYIWFSYFATLASTLAFYSFAGYKFRPVPNNPYLGLASGSDIELEPIDSHAIRSSDEDLAIDIDITDL